MPFLNSKFDAPNDKFDVPDFAQLAAQAGAEQKPEQVPPASPAARRRGRKAQEDNVKKRQTTVYLPVKDLMQLRSLSVRIGKPLTEIVEETMRDVMKNTYRCASPICNNRFILCANGEPAHATCCPYCGCRDVEPAYEGI